VNITLSPRRSAQGEPSCHQAGTWQSTRTAEWRLTLGGIVLSTKDADRKREQSPRARVGLARLDAVMDQLHGAHENGRTGERSGPNQGPRGAPGGIDQRHEEYERRRQRQGPEARRHPRTSRRCSAMAQSGPSVSRQPRAGRRQGRRRFFEDSLRKATTTPSLTWRRVALSKRSLLALFSRSVPLSNVPSGPGTK
jgi:hypothetical protein